MDPISPELYEAWQRVSSDLEGWKDLEKNQQRRVWFKVHNKEYTMEHDLNESCVFITRLDMNYIKWHRIDKQIMHNDPTSFQEVFDLYQISVILAE